MTLLEERYRSACQNSCRVYMEIKAAGFPDARIHEIADLRRQEDYALAELEGGTTSDNSDVVKFPVSSKGTKGKRIREEVMREFGMEIPPDYAIPRMPKAEGGLAALLFPEEANP